MAIFIDNFNSYTDGDLNGQGSWVAPAEFDVQGTTVYEGTKAVSCTCVAEKIAKKTGTEENPGSICIFVRAAQTNKNTGILFTTAANNGVIQVRFIDTGHIVMDSGEGTQDLGTYSADTWYSVWIQWHTSPDSEYRVLINNGTWSGWFNTISNRDPSTITQLWIDQADGTFYYDNICNAPNLASASLPLFYNQ